MPKMIPKVSTKSTFGRSGVRLLRFWVRFWGVWFLINGRSAVSPSKIRHLASEGRQKASRVVGSAGGAGSVWGFGVCRNRQKCSTRLWHPALRDGGGGSECAMRREHRRPRIWRSALGAAVCILQPANYRSVFWLFDILTFWYFDILTFWHFGFLAVWHFDILAI